MDDVAAGQSNAQPGSRDDYRAGVRAALPFVLPTLVLGISFGVLARTLGWGPVAPIAASLLIFSGSAQFAIASVLGAGGGAPAAILAATLVNTRFLPMGIAVAPVVRGGWLRRAVEGQAVVDASWAIAHEGEGRFDRALLIGATLPQWAAWLGGTVIGALGGDLIGDPDALGLDALFPAFFLVLLAAEPRTRRTVLTAALAAAIAVSLIPVAPGGLPIVAAALAALVGLRRP